MKSVGIITYHNYYNYGTMLQAYALQAYISQLGYSAELIDFKQSTALSKADLIKLRIRRAPTYLKEFRKYRTLSAASQKISEKNHKFDEFYNQNMIVSKQHYTTTEALEQAPPQYDGYVVGSDQTWNPYVSNNPDAFYLTFVADDHKKGCYGPSLAVSSLSAAQAARLNRLLAGFSYLSCREERGSELLREITKKQVTTVLDPTLLLTGSQWDQIAQAPEQTDPYILAYFLGDKKSHREFVSRLSEKTGFRVLSIPVSFLEVGNRAWEPQWVGPSEFLGLIKHAAYFCTDSFHGMMFAINYNTQFFSFCKMENAEIISENSRIYDALKLFSLPDRLITDTNLPAELTADFTEVNEILHRKRQEATAYLQQMLCHITEG